jgi:membrane protein
MKKIFGLFRILKKTFLSFLDDRGMKLAASLSYYTVFSIGPVLLIIMSLAGIFYGREAVQGKLYGEIKGMVGPEAAVQIQEIIQNVQKTNNSQLGATIGFIILFIGATGVFTEMQDSINFIWSIKAKPAKSWLKYIINRLISFSLIIGLGFILLVALFVNTLVELLSERLKAIFPDYSVYLFYGINLIILLIVISALFAVIYKVLPDAKIGWRDAIKGAIFTATLFLIGKFLIGYYLGNSNVGLTYGAAASLVIIFLWVYYSSIILYFGAEFTKVHAIEHGAGIKPKKTAVFIIKKEAKEIPESSLST